MSVRSTHTGFVDRERGFVIEEVRQGGTVSVSEGRNSLEQVMRDVLKQARTNVYRRPIRQR